MNCLSELNKHNQAMNSDRLFVKNKARNGVADYLRSHPHQRGIIVCNDKKFIYMKAAKTAGTAILRNVFEKQPVKLFHLKDSPQRFEKWMRKINDDVLSDYFIFSFVRNPWDRAVSISSYLNISLEDFVFNFTSCIKDEKLRVHSLPQSVYTHKDGVQFVDFIGRFETLQTDFNFICQTLDIEIKTLQRINASRPKYNHYSKYYNDSLVKQVSEIYEKDIEYYGYTYDPLTLGKKINLTYKRISRKVQILLSKKKQEHL